MESKADMLSRVCLMADGSETWDLSDNDTLALRHVLAERNEFKQSSELSALRIRELEAEIAVRDNMRNEVLRILREATGRRDFHSEMEAAEHAAKLLAEARRDGARLEDLYRRADVDPRGYLVFRPIQLPKNADWDGVTCKWDRDIFNAAIDAAVEGK